MVTNELITACVIADGIVKMIKPNTRDSLSKAMLTNVSQRVGIVMQNARPHIGEDMSMAMFAQVSYFIGSLINDPEFVETDMTAKESICGNLTEARDMLFLAAGKFYKSNSMDYSLGMFPIVKAIVDICISNGEYFGVDKEIEACKTE